MGEIKKINIYVGNVGQAYVDKETAKKALEAAQKNVADVQEIIDTATELKTAVEQALNGAQTALSNATAVINFLDTKLQENADNENVYEALTELKARLVENDTDNNPLNGGNVETANQNVTALNALLPELNDILATAQDLLADNQAYVDECQTAYDNANDAFTALIPNYEEESQADKSDKLEEELKARLDAVEEALENANNTTEAINNTTKETQDEANQILGGDEPTENTYYWYAGLTLPDETNLADIANESLSAKPTTWTNDPQSLSITNTTDESANFYYCFPTEWNVTIYDEDKTTEMLMEELPSFELNGITYTVLSMGRPQGAGATQNLYAKC